MRLLNVHSLNTSEFPDHDIPPYCILSHRWGGDEISYKDFRKRRNQNSAGYQKVVAFCEFVKRRKLPVPKSDQERERISILPTSNTVEWVWIDTCLIDGRSSAELSEAINSMFSWYEDSVECIVYLADLLPSDARDHPLFSTLQASQWFTRGWTLQELLAPRIVIFCNNKWTVVGHICNDSDHSCVHEEYYYGPRLIDEVSTITGIRPRYLKCSDEIHSASTAEKMSWAAHRRTTRPEDMAYSLLGIFKVNLPLLYGEKEKAFRRLQEEIIRTSDDQSIFAFENPTRRWDHRFTTSVLAISPAAFRFSGDVVMDARAPRSRYAVTNNGLEVQADLWKLVVEVEPGVPTEFHVWKLSCARAGERVEMVLRRFHQTDDVFIPVCNSISEPAHPPKAAHDLYKLRRGNTYGGKKIGQRLIYIEMTVLPNSPINLEEL